MITETAVVVRYAETDQMGVAHHANYAIWYEVARSDFMQKMGCGYSSIEEMGLLSPVLEIGCKYLSPAYYEDVLRVKTALTALSRVKMKFTYTIYKDGEEKPIHTGYSLHGVVDRSFKPVNMKKEYPALYQQFLSALETEK